MTTVLPSAQFQVFHSLSSIYYPSGFFSLVLQLQQAIWTHLCFHFPAPLWPRFHNPSLLLLFCACPNLPDHCKPTLNLHGNHRHQSHRGGEHILMLIHLASNSWLQTLLLLDRHIIIFSPIHSQSPTLQRNIPYLPFPLKHPTPLLLSFLWAMTWLLIYWENGGSQKIHIFLQA